MVCRGASVRPPAMPFNPYTLRGVSDRYRVSASIGLSRHDPLPARVLHLFTRFFHGTGTHDFELEVVWMDGPAGEDWSTFGPYTVTFRDTDSTRDFVFPMRNVPLWGVGRYLVNLWQVSVAGRDLLATEYFEVVQP